MKKLNTVIQYECVTSFKYIWIFYAIQYACVALITLIIAISEGSFAHVGANCLEANSLIYVGILGVLGFYEDFKMLIQNGFTRRYIFLATFSLFAFISGIMALVDTVIGHLLHALWGTYASLYGDIYGYGNVFTNWLWLFCVYLFVCSLFYLGVLVINRMGKTISLFLGVILAGILLLLVALFRFVFSGEFVSRLGRLALNAMGFMGDGSINLLFPVLTFLLVTVLLGLSSYGVIRRTELRG